MKGIFLPIFIFCSLNIKAQNIFDFDTLAKYSYLLIEASFHPKTANESPNFTNLQFEGNATCYFVRDSGRLFLCSALHVLSGCDVYAKKRLDSKVDFLVVRVVDELNQLRYVLIPIPFSLFKTLPCKGFLEQPDFVRFDATAYFTGIQLNSLEHLIFNNKKTPKNNKRGSIVSYGYPVNKLTGFKSPGEYNDFIKPTQYIGKIDTNYHSLASQKHLVDSMYILTTPSCYPGSSGAPVFSEKIYKKKKWIEFAGTTSGTNFLNNQSVITKAELFTKSLKKL